MFKKVLILTAIVLVLSACQIQADVIHSTWDAGGDGHTWSDRYNWDPNIVPNGPEFHVTIPGVDGSVVLVDGAFDVCSLRVNGDWALLRRGSFHSQNIHIHSSLTNNGYLDLIDIGIDGNIENKPGGEIVINEEVGAYWGDIENSGEICVEPGGELWTFNYFSNLGKILIHYATCGAETSFDNSLTGIIEGSGVIFGVNLFKNAGEIYAVGSGLVIETQGSLINNGKIGNRPSASLYVQDAESIHNNGLIEICAGGGVGCHCNLVNEPNAVIKLLGGTLAATTITQTADANFAGFGGIAGDVIIESNGEIKLTGPTNIVGDVEIRENATLEISDGTMLVTGQTTCNGTIHLKGGRIIPQGGLSGDCNIIWEPGLYANIADFNLDGKVNIKDFALFADTWLWQTSWY